MQQVQQVQQERLVLQVQPDRQEPLVQQVLQVQQAQQVQPDRLELQAQQELLEPLVQQDLQDLRDLESRILELREPLYFMKVRELVLPELLT